jgi:hypothetical protein
MQNTIRTTYPMKSILTLFVLTSLTFSTFAQAPMRINFQGVLRDNAGTPLRNQQTTVTVNFKAFSSGTLRYKETHNASTDNFGLIHLSLGGGTPVSGTFQSVDWADEDVSVSATATVGSETIEIQEQRFASVPYALHANTATALTGPVDTSITNELNQSLVLNGTTLRLTDAAGELAVDLAPIKQSAAQVPFSNTSSALAATTVQNAIDELVEDMATVNTDQQTLALTGHSLAIQNGNSIDLSDLKDDADANPENELQDLSIDGSTIRLSGSDIEINLTGIGVEADDQNATQVPYSNVASGLDATNVQSALDELAADMLTVNTDNQSLSLTDNMLSLTNGGSVDLSTTNQSAAQVPFAPAIGITASNVQNAIQELAGDIAVVDTDEQTLSFDVSTQSLSIEGGNSVNLSSLVDGDASNSNELNSEFALAGSILSITDAGAQRSVDLSSTNQNAAGVPFTPASDVEATNVQAAIVELSQTIAITDTDNQTLSLSGNTLSIADGNSVDLSFLEDDADASTTNEIQHIEIVNGNLSLTNSDVEIGLTGLEADDQTAAQVSYSGTASQMDADNVQEALEELAAEKVRNLQEAYAANSLITLDGTHELRINTSTGAPLLTTNNTTGQIGIGTATPDATLDVSTSTLDLSATLKLSNSDGSHRLNLFSGRASNPYPLIAASPDDALAFGHYNAGFATERMRIAANGNVGIGTATPDATLDVGSSGPDVTAQLEISNSDGSHRLNLFSGRTSSPNPLISVFPGDELRFAHYNGVTLTERMRIAANGNVGVGTNTPQGKIHVQGGTSEIAGPFDTFETFFSTTVEAGAVFHFTKADDQLHTAGIISSLQSTGNSTAIMGLSDGATATINRGLYGAATGGDNQNIGVTGNAYQASLENIGIRGIGQSSGAVNIGLSGAGVLAGTLNYGLFALGSGATTNHGAYTVAEGSGTTNYGIIATGKGATTNHGVRAIAEHAATTNYGMYASGTGATTNYGVYATASGGTTNYAGYFQGNVNIQGQLLINGVNASHKRYELANNNYSIGEYSLGSVASGSGNVAVGFGTMNSMTTGSNNLALGYRAMDFADEGSDNIALGSFSQLNSSASDNISIGRNTLQDATTGGENIAVGFTALNDNTTGTRNIALGAYSLSSNTTGASNVAVGSRSMEQASGGNDNVALGSLALFRSTGNNNLAFGYRSMDFSTSGNENIAIGTLTLFNSTGSGNVAMGQNAGQGILAAGNNVAIGASSDVLLNAERAVAIGYQAKVSQHDAILLGDANNAAVKVGIGTATPTAKLHVVGDVLVTGNVTAANVASPSDQRLKTNITPITDALTAISKLEGVSYFWKKDDPENAKKQFGLIAQELEKVIPELVQTNADGFKTVNYMSLIPFLLEAIKDQQSEIANLKHQNDSLKSTMDEKFDTLSAMIKTLEASITASQGQQTSQTNDKK